MGTLGEKWPAWAAMAGFVVGLLVLLYDMRRFHRWRKAVAVWVAPNIRRG